MMLFWKSIPSLWNIRIINSPIWKKGIKGGIKRDQDHYTPKIATGHYTIKMADGHYTTEMATFDWKFDPLCAILHQKWILIWNQLTKLIQKH